MFIYKITNLKNGKIYIGQTSRSINLRIKEHLRSSKKPKTILHKAIKHYGIRCFKIEEIDGANNETELNYKEWLWVYKLNCISPNGYNLQTGGAYRKLSKESIQKIKDTKNKENSIVDITSGRVYINAIQASEKLLVSYSKIYENLKNITSKVNGHVFKYFKEWDGLLIDNLGKKNSRKVVDLTTGIKYSSATEISKKIGVYPSLVIDSCSGKYTGFLKGKKFKYLEDWDGQLIIASKRKSSKVQILEINSNIIYNSLTEAAEKLNLDVSSITKVCKGKNNSTKGYRFQYV